MSEIKIADIKREFEAADIKGYDELIKKYLNDERSGVQKLIVKYKKHIDSYNNELARLYNMLEYERKYSEYQYIAGIDEVGRGPLAGPVCAGVVILPKDINIMYINDSKQLSAKKRQELYKEITSAAIDYKTALVSSDIIDEINILQATYEAMRQAVNGLTIKPDILLNDAVTIPEVTIRQVPIIKGDAKSVSIAAASIVAKVERDSLMEMYDELYPEYGFARNKGYGSNEHIAALKKYGPCPIHRLQFIKGLLN